MSQDAADAFGYDANHNVVRPAGMQVAEGKEPETLQPVVILYVRPTPESEQIGYAIPPDVADELAEQLRWGAQRARETHWEL